MRLDIERAEPLPPRRVVLLDGLNEGVDLLKIEARLVPWPSGVALVPELRLLGAGPGNRLGHGVVSPQVDEARAAEGAVEQRQIAHGRSGCTLPSLVTISSGVPLMTLAPKRPLGLLPAATAART